MPSDAEIGCASDLVSSAVKLLRGTKLTGELDRLQDQLERLQAEPTAEDIWRSVELARHQDRPYTPTTSRASSRTSSSSTATARADDPALVTGIEARRRRRAGGPPDGARPQGADEAELRHGVSRGLPESDAMALADRHGFPLVTMVNTPARIRVSLRQHGQEERSRAVRRRWRGSRCRPSHASSGREAQGGAVAIAAADRVLMQENAIYSVISPRVCRDPLARCGRGSEGRRRFCRTRLTVSSWA